MPSMPLSALHLSPQLAAPLGAMLGAIAGSFLSTLAIRWPAGRSIVAGRSACDGCGRPIPAAELVPIASFLLLAGRCRACGAAIDRRHPLTELLCAGIGLAALWLRPDAAGLAGALFGWWLAALALLDADHLWLPDRLTLPLGLVGFALGLGLMPPVEDRAIGAAVGYLGLEALRLGYRRVRGREGLGGGDPKLLGAIGAWLGWAPLPLVLLGASGLGLGWAIGQRLLGRPVTLMSRLPLGTLLAPAAFACWCAMAAGLIG